MHVDIKKTKEAYTVIVVGYHSQSIFYKLQITNYKFFIANSAYLEDSKILCPRKHMPFWKITNVVANAIALRTSYGSKKLQT